MILRVFGVQAAEAERLAEQMASSPTLLAVIDREVDKSASIEDIQLASGPATLISGKLTHELAIATANAVP